jgi:hypothetical protein
MSALEPAAALAVGGRAATCASGARGRPAGRNRTTRTTNASLDRPGRESRVRAARARPSQRSAWTSSAGNRWITARSTRATDPRQREWRTHRADQQVRCRKPPRARARVPLAVDEEDQMRGPCPRPPPHKSPTSRRWRRPGASVNTNRWKSEIEAARTFVSATIARGFRRGRARRDQPRSAYRTTAERCDRREGTARIEPLAKTRLAAIHNR